MFSAILTQQSFCQSNRTYYYAKTDFQNNMGAMPLKKIAEKRILNSSVQSSCFRRFSLLPALKVQKKGKKKKRNTMTNVAESLFIRRLSLPVSTYQNIACQMNIYIQCLARELVIYFRTCKNNSFKD